jgi:hypothetical protein
MVKINQMPVPTESPNTQREQESGPQRGIVHEYPPRAPLRRPVAPGRYIPVRDAEVRWQRLNSFFIQQIADSYESLQNAITSDEQMQINNALRTASNVIFEISTALELRRERGQ